jgi:hypothetical protein
MYHFQLREFHGDLLRFKTQKASAVTALTRGLTRDLVSTSTSLRSAPVLVVAFVLLQAVHIMEYIPPPKCPRRMGAARRSPPRAYPPIDCAHPPSSEAVIQLVVHSATQ